jgi:hypothetical protein
MKGVAGVLGLAAGVGALLSFAGGVTQPLHAQESPRASVLATVEIPVTVWADGKRLPAGTYDVTAPIAIPGVAEGVKQCGSCWVDFTQGGAVIGREQASIFPEEESGRLAKGPRPEPNGFRVDALQGGSYVRVWINRDGKDYIINLPTAP